MRRYLFKTLIRPIAAYSLLEVGVVLLIIGLLLGGIFKGADLVDNAKVTSLGQQYHTIRMATYTFMDRFGALPGDYAQAQTTFGGEVANGNGNGQLDGNEAAAFWRHLHAAKLLDGMPSNERQQPLSKLGSPWQVVQDPEGRPGAWLQVERLTPRQAQLITRQVDDGNATTGRVQSVGEGCVQEGGQFNLQQEGAVCTVLFKLL